MIRQLERTPPVTTPLAIVTRGAPSMPETIAQRIKRLQDEAGLLATQHVIELVEAMQEVARLASEAASFGESVPPGVRDLALRLAEDVPAKAQTIAALMERK